MRRNLRLSGRCLPGGGACARGGRPGRLLSLDVLCRGAGRAGDHRQAFRNRSRCRPATLGRVLDADHALDALESAVAGKAFVASDRFTAADVYVGSQIDWGLQFGTILAAGIRSYAAGLRERAGYKAAKAIDNALIAEMQAAQ
jgi:glutathione S-transferase